MSGTQSSSRWVICPKQNPQAVMRMFCFPYAGGGGQIFHSWVERIPPTVEVCPVQLPGRGSRLLEPLFTDLLSLVEAVAQNLLLNFDKPFVLFGHSMGAKISFELARFLRKEHNLNPIHLFVSGCRAPQIPDTKSRIFDLPELQFLEELRRLNGTPKEVLEHSELMQLTLPILRADFEVVQTYNHLPEPPLSCPITAFGGLQDEEVLREHLEAWREQTTASFSLHMFPGDHFFLHTSQRLILQAISCEVQRLMGGINRAYSL